MTRHLLAYAVTLVAFLALDLLWLGVIAGKLYRSWIGHVMMEKPNVGAAAIFYAVFVVGIVIFAVSPALTAGSWRHAVLHGALFGFFTYLTYDMTNLATIKGWPVPMVIADVLWGSFVTGAASWGGFAATSALLAGRAS
jgi:uncharacterized membrane protein